MKPQPIVFRWVEVMDPDASDSGELIMAMVPLLRYGNVAKRQFGDAGSEHVLEPSSERSMASHNQYFAALHDAFMNLPESVSARWPTEEHFRKWLLIEAGYFDERELTFLTDKKAIEAATFIRELDAYARIHPHGCKVLIQRARSQSLSAMRKEEFEASKKAVLELAEQFTGVSRTQAMKEAGRSA